MRTRAFGFSSGASSRIDGVGGVSRLVRRGGVGGRGAGFGGFRFRPGGGTGVDAYPPRGPAGHGAPAHLADGTDDGRKGAACDEYIRTGISALRAGGGDVWRRGATL